jgi:hypothetical protein
MAANPIKLYKSLDQILDESIDDVIDAAQIDGLPSRGIREDIPDPPQVYLSPEQHKAIKQRTKDKLADWLLQSHGG